MLQERILIGGAPGSGKTYAHLTIARALPKHKFYIIDPDDSVRRVWYSEFPDVDNIEYYFTPRWFSKGYETYNNSGPQADKLMDGSNRKNIFKSGVADSWALIKPKLKPGDWVIVEHLHLLWNSVQDSFADEVFEKKIGNYFLERRKALKAGAKQLQALEGWVDWPVINKMHNDDFMIEVCYENPGHVFLTTSVGLSDNPKEDTDIKAFYGDSSVRYEGQKHNAFRVQTHFITKMSGRGNNRKYIMNTFLKDRGREHLVDYEWSDFYYDYLIGIAGW